MYYINFFFIGSIIGYIFETCMKSFFFHSMNNGILLGPWIPIYGVGTCIILFVSKFSFKYKINKFFKLFMFFCLNFAIITVAEFIAGNLIELIFHKVFWDYSKYKFHIGHYICMEISFFWAILSLVFIYFVKPLEDLIIKKIPKIVTYLVLILFLFDIVITFLLKF